jgi:asparagine synthase (glutamine-hydrolysing)
MVSDVPVGVFLSGGYDSTTVAALLQKNQPNRLKTFTIGFKESGFDEAPFAKDIANYLGTEHHELYCSEQDAKDVIPLLSSIYDEPFGDSSAIPTYLVSKMAKEHVTVVLSADGGDETFFGYNRYPDIVNRFNKINKFSAFKRRVIRSILPIAKVLYRNNYQKQRNIEILKRSLNSRMPSMQDLNSWYIQRFSATELEKLLVKSETAFDGVNTYFNQTDIEKMDPVDQLLSTDYKTYLVDDILTKVDRATMAVSIEGREPLLDHRLIEFAAQLPLELKYKNKTQKYLLKQIAYKYLPKTLLDRPKSGFAIPLQKWFRTDLKYLLDEFLGEDLL